MPRVKGVRARVFVSGLPPDGYPATHSRRLQSLTLGYQTGRDGRATEVHFFGIDVPHRIYDGRLKFSKLNLPTRYPSDLVLTQPYGEDENRWLVFLHVSWLKLGCTAKLHMHVLPRYVSFHIRT